MTLPRLIRENEISDASWRCTVRDAVNGAVSRLMGQGATAERPSNPERGTMFYDTALGRPVWFDGAAWRDAGGSVA